MNSKKKGVWATILGFIDRTYEDHVGAYAAQSAYFIILSFIPFILLIMALVRAIAPLTEEMVRDAILGICPENIQGFIVSIINEVYAKSSAVIPVTAVTALWSAGKGLQAVINGLNTIYHVKETRNWLVTRIRSILYTLTLMLALLSSLLLLVFGNSLYRVLVQYVPFLAKILGRFMNARALLVFGVLVFAFLFLFKMLPNRRATFRSQLPGAVLTTVAWLVFSYGFSLYFSFFPSFSNMYGSLTTIVLIMLWLYICMNIVLYGAEVNAYFENQFRQAQAFARDLFDLEDDAREQLREQIDDFFDEKD